MVATTAFVLGFVALGLAVVFIAMGGGPKGARNVLHAGASPRGSAVSWGVGVVAAVVCLGIPVLILANNGGAQEKQGPGGVELTAGEVAGRHLFAQNCSTCHTLNGASAVGKVGPNLDQMRPPKALVARRDREGPRSRPGPDACAAADGQGRPGRCRVRRRRRRPVDRGGTSEHERSLFGASYDNEMVAIRMACLQGIASLVRWRPATAAVTFSAAETLFWRDPQHSGAACGSIGAVP